jgi:hypothetical protein
MEPKENWIIKLIRSIVKFLGEVFKESTIAEDVAKMTNDINTNKKELNARELLGSIPDEAKDVIIAEGTQFLLKNHKVLLGLTPEQREYAINLAYLKAIDNLTELTMDELIEYRKLVTHVAELGPDVAKQLNSFWTEFQTCISTIVDTVCDLTVRMGAVALKTLIPTLIAI